MTGDESATRTKAAPADRSAAPAWALAGLALVLLLGLSLSVGKYATGVIGWIGLLVPHVARMIVGPDLRRLLPAALGAPFFLYLLIVSGRGWR